MSLSASLGHILIIDDDPNIRELLQVNLRSEGYTVDTLDVAADADLNAMLGVRLVIVDAMHQDYSGIDFIFDLKDNPATEGIGVILYSNIKSERMVIDALDAGADDYVVKPFSLREMVARIKSVMRRHRPRTASSAIAIDKMEIDLASQTVRVDGQPLALSKTEFAILAMLVRNKDNYVSRPDIYRSVWGAEAAAGGNERVVDTNISRLRKKLGDHASHIINTTGMGYMIS